MVPFRTMICRAFPPLLPVLALTSVAGMACSSQELHPAGERDPDIEVFPLTLDFGEVGAGETELLEVTLTNQGDAPLRFQVIEIIGEEMGFAFASPVDLDTALYRFDTLVLPIQLAGGVEGALSATLHIISNSPDEEEVSIPLSGVGVLPHMELAPSLWDLGEVRLSCRAVASFLVTNSGASPLHLASVALAGEGGFSFEPGSLEGGDVVDPGGEGRIDVAFTPTAWAGSSVSLTVQPEEGEGEAAVAYVLGTGAPGEPVVETFAQAGHRWVDLLLVVANGSQMANEQENLYRGAGEIIDALDELDLEYHLAVLTPDEAAMRREEGEFLVTSPMGNRESRLEDLLRVGTDGEDSYPSLERAAEALSEEYLEGENAGFRREDAGLRIVFIADGPDTSPADLEEYLEAGWALVEDESRFGVMAVVGVDDASVAMDCEGSEGEAAAGTGFVEAALATGGVVTSLCEVDWDDFAPVMAEQALSDVRRFVLAGIPWPGTVRVVVEGVSISTGWVFDQEANAVVFDGIFVPENGEVVEVSYETGGNCP